MKTKISGLRYGLSKLSFEQWLLMSAIIENRKSFDVAFCLSSDPVYQYLSFQFVLFQKTSRELHWVIQMLNI